MDGTAHNSSQTQDILTQGPDLTQQGVPDDDPLLSPAFQPKPAFGRLMPTNGGPSTDLLLYAAAEAHVHVMGRRSSCQIPVVQARFEVAQHQSWAKWAFNMISNVHCRILFRDDQVILEDCSNNGTMVNSNVLLRKGQKRVLYNGDTIGLVNPQTLMKKMRNQHMIQELVQRYTFVFMEAPKLWSNRQTSESKKQTWIEKDYDVRDEVGVGTMGQVRRAIHRETGIERAVKIIQLKGQNLPDLQAEAEILRTLEHPYIVELTDVYITRDTLYLVMELLKGGDLFDRIVAKGCYSETDSRRVMRRLLSAVHYLHEEQNIVHRDIKPENILLSSRDNDVDVKLTDFGLAKTCKDEGLKTFCGTPQYFAPEVLRRRHTVAGRGRYGPAADMWSLGVILYVLLSGTPPFDTDQGIDMVVHARIDFPDEYWREISAEAKDLIQRLLVSDPRKRFTVQQACQHRWILTEDGDTHVHPLKDPKVIEAATKPRAEDLSDLLVSDSAEFSNHATATRKTTADPFVQQLPPQRRIFQAVAAKDKVLTAAGSEHIEKDVQLERKDPISIDGELCGSEAKSPTVGLSGKQPSVAVFDYNVAGVGDAENASISTEECASTTKTVEAESIRLSDDGDSTKKLSFASIATPATKTFPPTRTERSSLEELVTGTSLPQLDSEQRKIPSDSPRRVSDTDRHALDPSGVTFPDENKDPDASLRKPKIVCLRFQEPEAVSTHKKPPKRQGVAVTPMDRKEDDDPVSAELSDDEIASFSEQTESIASFDSTLETKPVENKKDSPKTEVDEDTEKDEQAARGKKKRTSVNFRLNRRASKEQPTRKRRSTKAVGDSLGRLGGPTQKRRRAGTKKDDIGKAKQTTLGTWVHKK